MRHIKRQMGHFKAEELRLQKNPVTLSTSQGFEIISSAPARASQAAISLIEGKSGSQTQTGTWEKKKKQAVKS